MPKQTVSFANGRLTFWYEYELAALVTQVFLLVNGLLLGRCWTHRDSSLMHFVRHQDCTANNCQAMRFSCTTSSLDSGAIVGTRIELLPSVPGQRALAFVVFACLLACARVCVCACGCVCMRVYRVCVCAFW